MTGTQLNVLFSSLIGSLLKGKARAEDVLSSWGLLTVREAVNEEKARVDNNNLEKGSIACCKCIIQCGFECLI